MIGCISDPPCKQIPDLFIPLEFIEIIFHQIYGQCKVSRCFLHHLRKWRIAYFFSFPRILPFEMPQVQRIFANLMVDSRNQAGKIRLSDKIILNRFYRRLLFSRTQFEEMLFFLDGQNRQMDAPLCNSCFFIGPVHAVMQHPAYPFAFRRINLYLTDPWKFIRGSISHNPQ